MITLGFVSKNGNSEFKEKMNSYFNGEVKIIDKICNPNKNGKYISEAYNEILAESETDIVIFVHDNIDFICTDKYRMRVDKSIEYQFECNPEFGIIGVGPRCQTEEDIIIRDYVPFDIFYTQCEEDGSNIEEITGGPTPKYSLKLIEDDLVDGVFLAVMKSRLKAGFDNGNKTFDFYDIDICLGNRMKGVKVGLTKAFNLLHYRSREEIGAWERYAVNKEPFLKRWEGKLPFISKQNKPTLLILTPSCNTDNLVELGRNVCDNFSGREDVNVFWAIAYDKFNSKGAIQMEELMRMLHKNQIVWGFYPAGKEGQMNYGGDLLNEVAQWIKQNFFSTIDPWIYVLDDDNYICPLMAEQVKTMTDTADRLNKKAIWMSMNREDGFIDTVRSYSIYGKGAFNNAEWSYADEFMPDPSELILRYSKLEEMGFYDGGYTYDQKIWRYFYEHHSEIVLPEDWHPGHWNGRGSNNFFQCYHNANNKEMLPYVEEKIKNKEPISFSLVVGTSEQCDRFVLDRQIGVDTFNKAKEKKYKYSILTCIFGNYETLKEIKDYREDVEYVCVTDNKELKSEQWKLVYEDDFFNKLPNVDRFAYVRFHPFNFVNTDVCITIDASVEILRDFYNPVVKMFLENGYEYAVTVHHDNETLYDDVQSWQTIRGYKKGDYDKILGLLGEDAKGIQGSVMGGFIIHKNTRYANKINEMTWELCHAFSTDNSADRNFQTELSYVVNKICNDENKIMLIHPYMFEGTFIRHWTHNGRYWIVYHAKDTCKCMFWNKKVEPIIFDNYD